MREEYIKMKNSNKWNINWFYKYFLEKGGKAQAQEFSMIFQQTCDLNTVIRNIDVEFGIVSLHAPLTKEEIEEKKNVGKFIKVIEWQIA